MEVFKTIEPLRKLLSGYKRNSKSIGFVPTMGALHAGHLALIKNSLAENDLTVCSIYVNPSQFNNPEDFKKYPKLLDQDIMLLENEGCDILFAPEDDVMYPGPTQVKFEFGNLGQVLEGQFRPGHFNGVGIVVSKLFNIVCPDVAYFGQKDLQQCLIIKQLARDLLFNIDIRQIPTVREADGLAMSSRNLRLSSEQRKLAPAIQQSLVMAKKMLSNRSIDETKKLVSDYIRQYPDFRLEYFEVIDSNTLEILTELDSRKNVALCIAIYIGDVRMIDNLFLFS